MNKKHVINLHGCCLIKFGVSIISCNFMMLESTKTEVSKMETVHVLVTIGISVIQLTGILSIFLNGILILILGVVLVLVFFF